jgi:hypothetical protein
MSRESYYEEALIEFLEENIKNAMNITTEEFTRIDPIYRKLPYDIFEHLRHCVIAKQKSKGVIKVGAGECKIRSN